MLLRTYIKTFLLGCPLNHLHGKSFCQQTKLETKLNYSYYYKSHTSRKESLFLYFLFMFVSAVSADEGRSTELPVGGEQWSVYRWVYIARSEFMGASF